MAQIFNMAASGNGGSGGDSGIDWTNHWDLPADRTTPIEPAFSFSELADGSYIFYFQVLNMVINYDNSVTAYAPKTFCVNFKVQTIDGSRHTTGTIERVLDRNEYSFTTQLYSDSDNVSKSYAVPYQTRDGIDIIMSDEMMFCAIPSYSPALVENAIRWSNIKNIATEEAVTPTLHVDGIEEGTTIGTLRTGPMVTIAPTSFISSVNMNANANQWGVDFKNTRVMSGYGRYQSELRISMTSATGEQFVADVYIDNASNVTPVYKIKRADGIFANAVVGSCGAQNLICVKFNFPSTMTAQSITVSAAKVGARGDAPSIGSIYTDAPSNYVEFAQLSVGATITAQTLGAIEQYTGSTTGTYTYGYFYKAVGDVVTTPTSLTATETSGTGVSVTVSDADGLLNYLVQTTGAAAAALKRYLGNPRWTWTYTPSDNTFTWAAIGDINIIDALQYFTLTPTPSDVVTWETSNWVDGGSSVQNASWERVDTQPLDLTGITGYDATKTQVLKNVQGVLTWVDE